MKTESSIKVDTEAKQAVDDIASEVKVDPLEPKRNEMADIEPHPRAGSDYEMFMDLGLDFIPSKIDKYKVYATWNKQQSDPDLWEGCKAWVKERAAQDVDTSAMKREIAKWEVEVAQKKYEIAIQEHRIAVINMRGKGRSMQGIDECKDEIEELEGWLAPSTEPDEVSEARRVIATIDGYPKDRRWEEQG